MNKIPIRSAIEANCWLKTIGNHEKEGFFKIRLIDFKKIRIKEIDDPNKISVEYNLEAGDIYLLKFDVVNFYGDKTGIKQEDIVVVDQDNFKFDSIYDSHLGCFSKFAEKSGLNKVSLYKDLMPKIKYRATLSYYLPKDDEAEYSITDHSGTICEL